MAHECSCFLYFLSYPLEITFMVKVHIKNIFLNGFQYYKVVSCMCLCVTSKIVANFFMEAYDFICASFRLYEPQ